jgi:hypothetical protein
MPYVSLKSFFDCTLSSYNKRAASLRSLSITGIVRMGTDVRRDGANRRQERAAEKLSSFTGRCPVCRTLHGVGACTVTVPSR